MGFYRSHKKFLLFLVSQTVSQMGSAMTGLAVEMCIRDRLQEKEEILRAAK